MRIAFMDTIRWDYQVESAYHMPLGGSQSALCYLAETLAQQGHDVYLLNYTTVPQMSRGVMCYPLSTVPHQLLRSLDALIVLNVAGEGMNLRSLVGQNTRLVLWTQHAHDQPGMQPLQNSAEREVYDGIALISDWQRNQFHEHFSIELSRTGVLRNAIGPTFCGLFPDGTPILTKKVQPPVLAYTSTPFRGLDILLEVFPRIRSAIPGTRLKVFSSMKVYQVAEADDEYSLLYRRCHETEGVEYIGSVPQPDLARELRSVSVLAYPNTFPETSCIAVMEAMASGCRIVTSDWGALPETTAGFARLVPVTGDWEAYLERFVEETLEVQRECTATDTSAVERLLRQQVMYVNDSYTWSVRAQEWIQWLNTIAVKPLAIASDIIMEPAAASSTDLHQTAYQCLVQGEYSEAATLYEQAIAACPTLMSSYWYLGLTLLLQGEEAQAQATWMWAMMNVEHEQIQLWTRELVHVLQVEAHRQKSLANYQTAERIQQYIAEIAADAAASD